MNNDAQSPRTYFRGASAKRLIVFAVLLANLLYSTLAFSQILGTGQLNIERRSHTATVLENEKVLIVGGDNQNGMVAQAEIFDLVPKTSALAASLIMPRTDHSANRLSDGRVLVIGGRDDTGSLQSTEMYNPLTTSFVSGPAMMRARSGHSATILANDKILVTGGDLFGSAEIYDPVTESFSLVVGSLKTPRKFHSAVLLQNGQVMIVGGVDSQNNVLNTAEVFDPASQTFYLPPTDMQTARAFATLKLLPDGKVQIIGGDAELSMEVFDPMDGVFIAKALLPPNPDLFGATLSTHSRAALFSPSISQDPLLQGILTAEQLSLLDRADQTITELTSRNQALVAGGVNSTGQVLNSTRLVSSSRASVTTDKTDYAPGQIVTISGSGYQPDEQVDIYFHEFPEEYPDIFLSAVANQQGNFVIAEFAPQQIDLGRIFTLTAIGQTSGFVAQTAFKDSQPQSVTLTPKTVTVNKGATANYTTAVTMAGNSDSCTMTLTVTFSAPAPTGVSVSFSGGATITTNNNFSKTLSLATTNTGPLAGQTQAGTYPFTVTVARGTGCQGSGNETDTGTLIVNDVNVATMLTLAAPSPASIPFGSSGPITLSATLTRTSGGAAVAGATTDFTVDAISVGSAVTNGSGVASITTYNPSALSVGGHPVQASFAGATISSTTYSASTSGMQTLTVTKADQTITFGALANKTYGDSDFGVIATASSGLAVSFSSLTAGICTVSGSTVHIVAAGPCIIRASQPGDSNYNAAPNVDQSFTVNKATLTVTADNQSRTYNVANPTLTATINGFANSETLATSGVTGAASCSTTATAASPASPPTYPITCTIGTLASSNYTFSFVAGALTINKANQTITGFAPASPITYSSGGTFALLATGGASGNPVIFASTTPSVCTVAGSTANIVSAGTCSLTADQAGSGNYEAASQVSANVVINKASQLIIFGALAPKTFGDADFTVSATGGASGNPVTFSSQTTAVCTVSGNTVHIVTAGSCTIRASQAGNSNYDAAADVDQSFTINKATPTVTVSGGPFTYDGNPHAATIGVTGVAGVAVTGTTSVTYNGSATVPMNADTYAVIASFTSSDTNYNNANGSGSITIEKASSTTAVTFEAGPYTYRGTAFTATAVVTGVGGLNQPVAVVYSGDCTNVTGTNGCTATATFAGDTNRNGSSDSKSITINKANQAISVTTHAPSSAIFSTTFNVAASGGGSGNAAVITTSGVCLGSGNNSASILMTSGTGTCTVKYNQAGNNNYHAAPEFLQYTTAEKATATVNLSGGGTYVYDGTARVVTATTAPSGLTVAVTYSGSATAPISVGTYTVVGTISDLNYEGFANATLVISAWTLSGFYQPVDMSSSTIVYNSVKGGSTVPLKFEIFAGSIELKDVSAVKSLSAMSGSCGGGMDAPIDELSATGGTSLRYDTTGGQFIFNWQTPKGANNCYKVTMITQDGSGLSAYFKTK